MNHKHLLPGVPLVESPFFEQFAEQVWPDPEMLRIARDLNRQGFAVFDFPEPDFASLAARIRTELRPQFAIDEWRQHGAGSLRVQDAWKAHADVRHLAAHPRVLDMLSSLYGRRAWLRSRP